MDGNQMKMRDALTPWVSLGEWLIENAGKEALGRGIAEIVPTLRKRIDESKAALAAPPRQCDVGTAEEQAERFHAFCDGHSSGIGGMCDGNCPCFGGVDGCHCLCKWAQMPYAAKEGGSNNG